MHHLNTCTCTCICNITNLQSSQVSNLHYTAYHLVSLFLLLLPLLPLPDHLPHSGQGKIHTIPTHSAQHTHHTHHTHHTGVSSSYLPIPLTCRDAAAPNAGISSSSLSPNTFMGKERILRTWHETKCLSSATSMQYYSTYLGNTHHTDALKTWLPPVYYIKDTHTHVHLHVHVNG